MKASSVYPSVTTRLQSRLKSAGSWGWDIWCDIDKNFKPSFPAQSSGMVTIAVSFLLLLHDLLCPFIVAKKANKKLH